MRNRKKERKKEKKERKKQTNNKKWETGNIFNSKTIFPKTKPSIKFQRFVFCFENNIKMLFSMSDWEICIRVRFFLNCFINGFISTWLVSCVVPLAACTNYGHNQSPRWSTRVIGQSGLVKDLVHVLFRWCNLTEKSNKV
jgi:hypothetical protein